MEPQPGFYYHYKHDPAKDVFNYAYEVLNIGHHTEIEDWKAGEMVVYRPLYPEAKVFQAGGHWDVRPRTMFLETVLKNDNQVPRFQKIQDPKIIEELRNCRNLMYAP